MLIPKTRKEIYQVYLSGDTDLELPKPVTRDEIILYNACINGAGVPPAGGGGGAEPFVVTMSKHEMYSEELRIYSADQTPEDILAAIQAGRVVYAMAPYDDFGSIGRYVYSGADNNDNFPSFMRMYNLSDPSNCGIDTLVFADGVWLSQKFAFST